MIIRIVEHRYGTILMLMAIQSAAILILLMLDDDDGDEIPIILDHHLIQHSR